jgi:hypothetical protein
MSSLDSTRGFLTTIGYITGQGRATVRLGYLLANDDPTLTQRLKAPDAQPITVSQFDASANLLLETVVPGNPMHADPHGNEALLVSGKVPLAAATTTLVWSLNKQEVYRFQAPPHAPVLELTWQPPGSVTGPQTITWKAAHPDGAPMEFLVCYSFDGGKTLQPRSPSITTASYELNFDQLPGGIGQVCVLATDGGNTTTAATKTFPVPIKPAYTVILTPANNATVKGRWVTLQGQGFYREEDKPELDALAWESSKDGKLGSGPVVQTRLSPGAHLITLTAGAPGDRQGTATITLNVT